ncbi:MAG TPA: NAD(P)-dependent oxidoreductase [Ktedonobacterales bacterium]
MAARQGSDSGRETIVVTGSSGLIGAAVCTRLARRFTVVAFDRPGPPYPPAVAECLGVDMTSDASVHAGFAQVRARHGRHLAAVVHLAAFYDFDGQPSPLYDALTIQGTRRVLEELRSFQCEQLLFSSTMFIHAPCQPGERINEDWPLEPKWPYPQSKVATEALIHERRGPVPAAILRIAGVYDDLCHSIPIAHQIQRIWERQLISHVFPGDTSHGQSFVHLEDVVDAIGRTIARRKQLPAEVPILIGEPETLSYQELQDLIAQELFGERWVTERIPKELAKVGAWLEEELPLGEEPFIKPWMIDLADDHYSLDITRARQFLGWEPRRALRSALPIMLAGLKRQPDHWYTENHLTPPPHSPQAQPQAEAGAQSS